MVTTLVLISAPVFWLGLVLLYLFAEDIGQFSDLPRPGHLRRRSPTDPSDWAGALILPWIVLAAALGGDLRPLPALEPDRGDGRGLHPHRAREGAPRAAGGHAPRRAQRDHPGRHPARRSTSALLLAGNAILTESVFNIPGVGRLIFTAIERSDLPVIQGVVLFGAFFIIIFNLLVDIAYAYLDPRVRYQ